MAERTIAELSMGSSCLLTLTSKHLRGQFLRLVQENGATTTIKDQIDVVLSGIAGYTIQHTDKSSTRIGKVVVGVLIAAAAIWLSTKIIGAWLAVGGVIVGALVGLIGWLSNPDVYIFAINVMGSQTLIPIAKSYSNAAQEFVVKLQNAKAEYDESK